MNAQLQAHTDALIKFLTTRVQKLTRKLNMTARFREMTRRRNHILRTQIGEAKRESQELKSAIAARELQWREGQTKFQQLGDKYSTLCQSVNEIKARAASADAFKAGWQRTESANTQVCTLNT